MHPAERSVEQLFGRRLLLGVFGLGLTAAAGTIAGAPLLSASHDEHGSATRGVAVVMQRTDGTMVTMEGDPGPDGEGTATMRVIEEADVAGPAPASWIATPGDSLWSLAERGLSVSSGRSVSEAELVPYWRTVVERNRSRLVDPTNADLIFPGQVFEVPPVPDGPGPSG